jgi:hypothetical protein
VSPQDRMRAADAWRLVSRSGPVPVRARGKKLRLVGDPVVAATAPFAVPRRRVRVSALEGLDEPSLLALVDDPADVVPVAEELGRAPWSVPVIVAAERGAPEPIARALRELRRDDAEAGSAPRFASIPPEVEDGSYLRPVLLAEALRGNTGRVYPGGLHDTRAAVVFRSPVDLEALEAEFELGDGMAWVDGDRPGVAYDDADGQERWRAAGFSGAIGTAQARLRDAWWEKWRAAPRPRTRLINPFREATS